MDRRPPIPVNTGYEPVAQNESRDVPHRQIHTPGHGAMHNWVPRNHFAMVFQQPICIYQANTSMLPLFYSPNSVAGPRFPAPTAYYGNIFPCYPSMANSNQSMHQQTSERVAVFNHYMPEEAPPYQQAMHQQFQMSENVDTRSWQDQTRHVSQNTFGPLNNVARMQKAAIDFSPDEEHGNHPGSVVEDIIGSISQPEVQATSMTYPAMNCEIQKTAIGAERRSNLIRGTHLAYLRQNQRVCYKFQNNGLLTYPTFEGTRISEPLPAVLEEQSDEPYTLRTALGAMNLEQKEGNGKQL